MGHGDAPRASAERQKARRRSETKGQGPQGVRPARERVQPETRRHGTVQVQGMALGRTHPPRAVRGLLGGAARVPRIRIPDPARPPHAGDHLLRGHGGPLRGGRAPGRAAQEGPEVPGVLGPGVRVRIRRLQPSALAVSGRARAPGAGHGGEHRADSPLRAERRGRGHHRPVREAKPALQQKNQAPRV